MTASAGRRIVGERRIAGAALMQPHDHSGEPPDRDTFARWLIEAVGQASETGPIHYDREKFTLRGEGGRIREPNLKNISLEYCQSTRGVGARIFSNFALSCSARMRGLPEEFEDARHDVLPAIRA